MRILHIASSRYGGAGRAAWRQHLALLAAKVDSRFLSMDPEIGDAKKGWYTLQPPPSPAWQFWKRKKNEMVIAKTTPSPMAQSFQQQIDKLAYELQCEVCSIPFSTWPLHQHALVLSADVINLHWVAGIIDYPGFFSSISKPIVWTLHDMHPFLGLFHYEQDEHNNPSFQELNTKARELKSNCIKEYSSKLVLTAPSHWLINKALDSDAFKGLQAHVIPYSVNLETFRPLPKTECRRQLRLPLDKHIILFVSHQLDTPRKGFGQLHASMELLAESHPEWGVVTIGNAGKVPKANYWTLHIGSQTDDQVLATYFGAADIIALPSLEDNLPNVLLEAFACGRPVITCNNGGMAEHIQPEVNGWISNDGDFTSLLSHAMLSFESCNAAAIRMYAEESFSAQKQAKKYDRIYHSLTLDV